MGRLLACVAILLLLSPMIHAEDEGRHNVLSDAERTAGWQLLFDGSSFAGWRGLGRSSVPEGHWVVLEGCIKKVATKNVPLQEDGQPLGGGDLMTEERFRDFELSFEWKVTPGGNSGVKYNVSEELSTRHPPSYAALGFEYQVLDDDLHPDAEVPSHRAGSLYDLLAAENKVLRTVGEFNRARVVLHGTRGEHWLNGVKVLEFDLASAEMRERLQASKYRSIAGFADRRSGHIVLQDHTDEVWFRNLKIRPLPVPP